MAMTNDDLPSISFKELGIYFFSAVAVIAGFYACATCAEKTQVPSKCFVYTINMLQDNETFHTNTVTTVEGFTTFIDAAGKLRMVKGDMVITIQDCPSDDAPPVKAGL
jgi:hypothetical protein